MAKVTGSVTWWGKAWNSLRSFGLVVLHFDFATTCIDFFTAVRTGRNRDLTNNEAEITVRTDDFW